MSVSHYEDCKLNQFLSISYNKSNYSLFAHYPLYLMESDYLSQFQDFFRIYR